MLFTCFSKQFLNYLLALSYLAISIICFFSHFIHPYYFMLMIIRSSKTFFYSLSNTKFIAFAFGINLH